MPEAVDSGIVRIAGKLADRNPLALIQYQLPVLPDFHSPPFSTKSDNGLPMDLTAVGVIRVFFVVAKAYSVSMFSRDYQEQIDGVPHDRGHSCPGSKEPTNHSQAGTHVECQAEASGIACLSGVSDKLSGILTLSSRYGDSSIEDERARSWVRIAARSWSLF